RVIGNTVKFLTLECDETLPPGFPNAYPCGVATVGTDLNGDGDADDLVIEVYDAHSAALTVLGSSSGGDDADPLSGGTTTGNTTTPDNGGGSVFQSTGRCIETLGGSCTADGDCSAGAFCEAGTCKKDQGVCTTTTDCPPSVSCDTSRPIVAASPD